MRTFFLRVALSAIFFFSLVSISFSQEEFVNYYGKINADGTLKLNFIDHDEDYTTLHISYLGTTNVGSYTGLYLNNLRIVDRETGISYKPTDTGLLPTTSDGKVFFYNSGDPTLIQIQFDRLPSYVKSIDVIESDGSSSSTFNFTFRNLRISPLVDDSDEFWEFIYDIDIYASTIFSVFDATIDLYISGTYVGKLDRVFKSAEYTPSCGEFGTLTVVYPTDAHRTGYGTTTSNGKKYTWDFTVKPSSIASGCHKQRLK